MRGRMPQRDAPRRAGFRTVDAQCAPVNAVRFAEPERASDSDAGPRGRLRSGVQLAIVALKVDRGPMATVLNVLRRLSPGARKGLHRFSRRVLGVDFFSVADEEQRTWHYQMNAKLTARLFHFQDLLRRIDDVEGRIVECGVGPGQAIFAFGMLTRHLARPREIVGFDTFEGMPPATTEDGAANAHKAGWWRHAEANVRALLAFNGLDADFIAERIRFVPGLLQETLVAYDGGPIAFLHLDVDFYDSYKVALRELWPFVVPNGIVAFDEYRSEAWPGATQAIDEFLATQDLVPIKSPFLDRWYVVKPVEPTAPA